MFGLFSRKKEKKQEELDSKLEYDRRVALCVEMEKLREKIFSVEARLREDFNMKNLRSPAPEPGTYKISQVLQNQLDDDIYYLSGLVGEYFRMGKPRREEKYHTGAGVYGLMEDVDYIISAPCELTSPAREIIKAMRVEGRFIIEIGGLNTPSLVQDCRTGVKYYTVDDQTIVFKIDDQYVQKGEDVSMTNYDMAQIAKEMKKLFEFDAKRNKIAARKALSNLYPADE